MPDGAVAEASNPSSPAAVAAPARIKNSRRDDGTWIPRTALPRWRFFTCGFLALARCARIVRLHQPRGLSCHYTVRVATAGEIAAARRAGTQTARTPTTHS